MKNFVRSLTLVPYTANNLFFPPLATCVELCNVQLPSACPRGL